MHIICVFGRKTASFVSVSYNVNTNMSLEFSSGRDLTLFIFALYVKSFCVA